jgi:ATP-dependent DNA helicase RecG
MSLNLAAKEGIKNAGVMFFAKDPRRHILQCQMTIIAFKGTDRVHIIDRKDVQDDLWTQYKEAMIFLERHLNVRTEIKGLDREDIYEVPLEAIREAVANAIIHRDYAVRGTSIMVEVHEDRVVISNPGGFPVGMSAAKLGDLSVRRNELIADMFARMHRVERVGSGFKRIKRFLEEAGLPFPVVKSDDFFVICFTRPPYSLKDRTAGEPRVTEKVTEKVTENQQKILDTITANQHITALELARIVGISERKIKDNLKKLKDKGLLTRIGPDKGGHWKVTG